MNTGYPKADVEKVKLTQLQRHAALRFEKVRMLERLGKLDESLKAVFGNSPMHDTLVDVAQLLDRLTAELRREK